MKRLIFIGEHIKQAAKVLFAEDDRYTPQMAARWPELEVTVHHDGDMPFGSISWMTPSCCRIPFPITRIWCGRLQALRMKSLRTERTNESSAGTIPALLFCARGSTSTAFLRGACYTSNNEQRRVEHAYIYPHRAKR